MINQLFSLEGRRALVTGSSRGIGLVLCRGLGLAGATVVVNGRDVARLEAAVAELAGEGIAAHRAQFDILDQNAIESSIEAIEQDVGAIDILVNNAGVQIRAPLENFALSEWKKIIDTNLSGAFLVTQSVVRRMIERKAGKVINICSLQSELGRTSIGPYTASKGGLKMLTKAMATEWGHYNIQTNGIGPGYFVTEMTQSLADNPEFDSWLKKRTPAGRWGNPSELIGTAVYLASAASDFVNGQIIYVDGGVTASL